MWLSGLTGAAERLRQVAENALALQFGGAAGTLAALGDNGTEGPGRTGEALKLKEARSPGMRERGRIFDIAAALAGLSGACAKIATDMLLLMQSEVAEAFEPAAPGKGGSSTMPHKRNPVGAIAIRANHRRIAGLMATIDAGARAGARARAPAAGRPNGRRCASFSCFSAGSVETASATCCRGSRSIPRACAKISMRRSGCRSPRA